MPDHKALLRAELLARRTTLDPDHVARISDTVQRIMAEMPELRRAREVLLYMAVRNEIHTHALLDYLLAHGARVLLPRCDTDRPGHLHLACITCRDELIPGMFGILEPHPECRPVRDFAPQVAVVPGVGFDAQGHRLGYGGGYYDRLLAQPAFAETLLVAPAHDFQVLPELPVDPWDRPVHRIVTATRTFEIRL